jgi:hypothetical protein
MVLQQAEGHPVPLEEITVARDQQEAALLQHVILLQLEEALTLQERAAQLLEAIIPDVVLTQQEEAVIHQILGTIILRQESPLLLKGVITEVILEVHHQEALNLEVLALKALDLKVLVREEVHLKKEKIRQYYS